MKSGENAIQKGLFLIVPASPYNASVPVLIGSNLLGILMKMTEDYFGQKFLQDAKLTTLCICHSVVCCCVNGNWSDIRTE